MITTQGRCRRSEGKTPFRFAKVGLQASAAARNADHERWRSNAGTTGCGMQIISDPGAVATPCSPSPPAYSEAWWAKLSAEDLHDLVMRGFAAGEIFDAAVAETKRREDRAAKLVRDAAAADAESRRQRKLITAAGLAGVAIIVIAISAAILLTVF